MCFWLSDSLRVCLCEWGTMFEGPFPPWYVLSKVLWREPLNPWTLYPEIMQHHDYRWSDRVVRISHMWGDFQNVQVASRETQNLCVLFENHFTHTANVWCITRGACHTGRFLRQRKAIRRAFYILTSARDKYGTGSTWLIAKHENRVLSFLCGVCYCLATHHCNCLMTHHCCTWWLNIVVLDDTSLLLYVHQGIMTSVWLAPRERMTWTTPGV